MADRQIRISWGSYTQDLIVTGYNIHRSYSSFTPSVSTIIATTDASTRSIEDTVDGDEVFYAVEAIVDGGDNMFSDIFMVEPPDDATAIIVVAHYSN